MEENGRLKLDDRASMKLKECRRFMISGLERIIQIADEKGQTGPSDALVYRKSFTSEHDLAYTINISKRKEGNGDIYRMALERYKKGNPPRMDKNDTMIEFRKDGNIISDFNCESNDYIELSMMSVSDAYSREFKKGPFSERHPWTYNGVKLGVGSAVAGTSIYIIGLINSWLSQPNLIYGYGMTMKQAEAAGVAYPTFYALSAVFGLFALGGTYAIKSGMRGFLEHSIGLNETNVGSAEDRASAEAKRKVGN